MILKKKKETTIDDLAMSMEKGFKKADKRLETTVNSLAAMISKGFNEMKESNAREHKEMAASNEREHEEIKLSLNNVAYRFELVELQKRVEVLERRVRVV